MLSRMALTSSLTSSSLVSSLAVNWQASMKRSMAMMRLIMGELLSNNDSPEMTLICSPDVRWLYSRMRCTTC